MIINENLTKKALEIAKNGETIAAMKMLGTTRVFAVILDPETPQEIARFMQRFSVDGVDCSLVTIQHSGTYKDIKADV